MLKKLWAKVKGLVTGLLTASLKAKIMEAIDSLDQYEDDLADAIKNAAKVDDRAKAAMDYLQKKLKELVEKVL